MSAIPGFNNDEPETIQFAADDQSKKKVTVQVPRNSEWRVEIPFSSIVKIVITKGVAELYGTELPLNVELKFTGAKICFYAPIEEGFEAQYSIFAKDISATSISDENEVAEYISEDSTMGQLTNLHFIIESMRQKAQESPYVASDFQSYGPRVMVLGGAHTGKTSIVRTLASYANKMDRCPIVVNLDPKVGVFSLPGSLTSTPISDALDVEGTNGWGSSPTSGITYHNPKQPIVKNYGFESISDNLDLYKYQCTQLALTTMSRLKQDKSITSSGLLIDTPTLSIKEFPVIENIVSDFEVNLLVVIGNERLLNDLKKKFKHKLQMNNLHILKLAKSGGIVEIDDSFIRNSQQQTIRDYFYGDLRSPLSPYNTVVDVKDVIIYKCVETREVNSSLAFLPSGDSFSPDDSDITDGSRDDFQLEKYYTKIAEPTGSELNNTILAITFQSHNDKQEKNLLNTSVKGYAYVSEVDDSKGKMRILLPVPGALPRNILILTGIRYIE